jgi:hypothetical protein
MRPLPSLLKRKTGYGGEGLSPQLHWRHRWKDSGPGCWGKMLEPIWKITKAKRVEDMIQMIEHLLNKCKSLSSNLSTLFPLKKYIFMVDFNIDPWVVSNIKEKIDNNIQWGLL